MHEHVGENPKLGMREGPNARTSDNQVIEFTDMKFENDPIVFVVTNRFGITYGMEGKLEKANLIHTYNKKKITFSLSQHDQEMILPVCILAYEKNS